MDVTTNASHETENKTTPYCYIRKTFEKPTLVLVTTGTLGVTGPDINHHL